ncbi:Uncharacterised protein [Mannheimia haemolytica]|uniref:Uncharacterized protein n=1 Tax=Mannheimia haemolytica TaxID=75985 RepID=A0A3S5F3N8_MANHA|nr:hypothetical protein [Mannheimia haemolytica]UQX67232.1 hypothetical protein M3704_08270 [Mannheimia haemolytica]STY62519.1 Uncharacterised protein [Mannheimia haemolytica]VEI78139.1 Uncharacterised protein [Mannheimia haemolytica]
MSRRYLFYFSLLISPFTYSNEEINEALKLDPRVQQFAEDLMQKEYSYEDAFEVAVVQAKQCLYGKSHPNSRICQSYGLWKIYLTK